MATSRRSGGRCWTGRPSKRISPSVTSSSPATMLRVVVLPQPEGPSSTVNDPSGTSRSIESTATTGPNSRRRLLSTTSAIALPLPHAGQEPANQVPLRHQRDEDGGQRAEQGAGGHQAEALLPDIVEAGDRGLQQDLGLLVVQDHREHEVV